VSAARERSSGCGGTEARTRPETSLTRRFTERPGPGGGGSNQPGGGARRSRGRGPRFVGNVMRRLVPLLNRWRTHGIAVVRVLTNEQGERRGFPLNRSFANITDLGTGSGVRYSTRVAFDDQCTGPLSFEDANRPHSRWLSPSGAQGCRVSSRQRAMKKKEPTGPDPSTIQHHRSRSDGREFRPRLRAAVGNGPGPNIVYCTSAPSVLF